MHTAGRYGRVTEVFGALASPVRAAIVHKLIDGPSTVTDLGKHVGASQPLVSQHLRVLRETGLVRSDRSGRTTSYSLVDQHVAHMVLDAFVRTQEDHQAR